MDSESGMWWHTVILIDDAGSHGDCRSADVGDGDGLQGRKGHPTGFAYAGVDWSLEVWKRN